MAALAPALENLSTAIQLLKRFFCLNAQLTPAAPQKSSSIAAESKLWLEASHSAAVAAGEGAGPIRLGLEAHARFPLVLRSLWQL